MNAVAEHGPWPSQPRPRVDVDIVLRLRIELGDAGDLGLVLVGVGLDIATRELTHQGARRFKLGLGRGHGETRRDRIIEAPATLPALDQRFALVVAPLCGVHERLRRVAVHHHLAGDHARAAVLGCGEERIDRLRMDRAIDHRGRGAGTEQFVEKEFSDPGAMRGIGEFLLLDEGIVVEPVEQLRAVGADHLGLGIMDMRVDETRRDEGAGVIVDERVLRRTGENLARSADRLDHSRRDENSAVVDQRVRRWTAYRWVLVEGQDAAANHPRFRAQLRMSLRRSAAIRSISASAAFVSASASLARRRRKAARISALLLPLTAMMKGKPKRAR